MQLFSTKQLRKAKTPELKQMLIDNRNEFGKTGGDPSTYLENASRINQEIVRRVINYVSR